MLIEFAVGSLSARGYERDGLPRVKELEGGEELDKGATASGKFYFLSTLPSLFFSLQEPFSRFTSRVVYVRSQLSSILCPILVFCSIFLFKTRSPSLILQQELTAFLFQYLIFCFFRAISIFLGTWANRSSWSLTILTTYCEMYLTSFSLGEI